MLPIFIDIDGTLTDDAHNADGKPIKKRIESVWKLIKEGNKVILWSARGREYVRKFAFSNRFGIDDVLCIGKPKYCIDDKPHIINKQIVKDPTVLD